jgi:hypothetical protein
MRLPASGNAAIFLLVATIGAGLRAYVSTLGYNWDTGMLFKIAELPFGANFYSAFPYYANWGPIPYTLFQLFRSLPGGDDIVVFHGYLAALTSAFDLLTGFVLWRLWGLRAAVWFLALSPIAIILAGFHCNAEPAMVAFVLLGYYIHVRRGPDPNGPLHPAFLILIGVSLSFKHSFILFPVWLAMRPVSWKERMAAIAIPYGVWLAAMLYYLVPEPSHVIDNVLRYRGWAGNSLVPTFATWLRGGDTRQAMWTLMFLGSMLLVGWGIRSWRVERLLLLYPLALVATASALALQYFNLTIFSIAAHMDPIGVLFNVFSLYFYSGHADELHLFVLPPFLRDVELPAVSFMPPVKFNWGWLMMQTMIAAIMIRRMVSWSQQEREAGMSTRITHTHTPSGEVVV